MLMKPVKMRSGCNENFLGVVTMTAIFADECVGSIYDVRPIVTVELSRNGFPLGFVDFHDGNGFDVNGILSEDAAELLDNLLDLGWESGTVDGVDFRIV